MTHPALSRLRDAAAATAEALANPSVKRVQAGFMLGVGADAALMVLLAVTAYGRSGAIGVALVGAARMLPMIVFGLASSAPLARWRADQVLAGLAVVRAAAAVGAFALLVAGAPDVVLYVIAGVLGAAAATVTPVQYTLLPALARTPRELVVANVATGSAESIGSFAGPLIAGACIALGGSWLIGLGAALALVIDAGLVLGIRFEDEADARPEPHLDSGFALGRGVRAIRDRPVLGLIIAAFSLQTLVRAALAILLIVLSVDVLGTGEAGVGFLVAVLGFGGALGMIGGLALRTVTAGAFAVALVGWGLPISILGLLPLPIVAIGALLVVGISNALLDVTGYTLLQRSCRNEDRGKVMALLEASVGIGALVGSLVTPAAILVLGARGALIVIGALLPITALVVILLARRFGNSEAIPSATIDSLRRVPAFRVLPLTGLERLVMGSVEVRFDAGDVLMAKGEPGDRFLLIEEGTVEISDEGRVLRELGPGAGLGEIALLRGGARTATARALTAGHALAIDVETFRAAVAGPAASAAAEQIIEEHLAHSESASATC